MKKTLTFLAFLGIVALLGCVQSTSTAFDCGRGAACFKEYARNCTSAKVVASSTELLAPSQLAPNVTLYLEIKEGTPGACRVYVRIDDFTIPPDFLTQQQQQAAMLLKGMDMTCIVPTDATTFDLGRHNCTGALMEVMKTLIGAGYSPVPSSGGGYVPTGVGGGYSPVITETIGTTETLGISVYSPVVAGVGGGYSPVPS